ncbi:hypothetical protein [Acaryochloris sp. IP29b_bin.148]|uniref:hypothetical protein n=1 Tax=Acaryochloris sp. IP29b_bin.148 TaxID=2969218 RepID=UPI0026224E9E|nr:hypothetical protein [Acaryochloris sp. IP29b_bin.148]
MIMVCPPTLKPKVILGFITSATLLTLLVGSLAKVQWIALDLDIAARLPPPAPYWHMVVALMGLLMPILMRVWHRRQRLICRILDAYLIVFIAQILSELILTPIFLRGIAVIIGSLYSTFRLLQLWQSQTWVTKASHLPQWFTLFLWSLMAIWLINLLRFILYRWPVLLS